MESTTTTTTTTTTLRLFDLPPELRNMIYEFVASDTTKIAVSAEGKVKEPPIAVVSKQVRLEFMPIYEACAFVDVELILADVTDYDLEPLIEVIEHRLSDIERRLHVTVEILKTQAETRGCLSPWITFAEKQKLSTCISSHRKGVRPTCSWSWDF